MAGEAGIRSGVKVAVAGLEITVLVGGTGPTLLVLHRDTGRGGWTRFHQLLAERFTVYAPALPGFDDSTRPAWMRTVAELATTLGLAVDALGVAPCAVVGLGFGGWVAAEAAVQCPHRFNTLVLHAPVGLQPAQGEIVDQFLYSAPDYVRMGFADAARFTGLFGDAREEPLLRAWDWNREMTTRIAWKPYMFNRSLPALLPALRIPTLVVRSTEDRIVPGSVAERYAELIPDARIVDLPGAGHQADLEAPDALAAAVGDFLAGS
jgi:pimeloyl-ACP methyl ester carboxylesterase